VQFHLFQIGITYTKELNADTHQNSWAGAKSRSTPKNQKGEKIMFQIISFKEDGLANLALIKLCEDDSVRLLRSLNPDAEDGVQGEEFGEEWTLADRGAAAAAFLNNGFWKTWTDINGTACGGINLYDQLCEEGVRQFMEMNDHPFVVCNDEYDAANAVLSLSPGLYLFYVPVLYDIPSESDAEDADTCSEEEIIESEAFKTVYEHAVAGGMSKDDAYTEAYVAALQEISPFAVRVGFVNPDTGSDDETEFDVNSIFEALNLFRNDFREDNHWKEMPKILYIESVK
jgi:hypothetical protein